MHLQVHFYSYYKELTGCAQAGEELPEGSTMNDLWLKIAARFPKLAALEHATLMVVGVEYRERSHVLHEGDEVSLFPPVQGG